MPDEGRRAPRGYDATLKHLVEARPAEWLTYLGLPTGTRIGAVDADVSSVSAAADKVLRVEGNEPYIAHLEFQSGLDADLDRRMLLYNVLLRSRHGLPVRSVVFLLHPRTVTKAVLGRVQDLEDPHCRLEFSYRLVRVWEQPPGSFLNGGLATLVLAAVSSATDSENELAVVYARIAARLRAEASDAEAREIWMATLIMSGLRHDLGVVERLMKGAWNMGWEENSVTYQAIIERGVTRGRLQEARAAVLVVGRKRLGEPDVSALTRLQAISDPARLEQLLERALTASSWSELLAAEVS